eukprot:GHRR01009420.1.p1 GENE.GHRR01009420.1~~GHRR01009420.1.p1  ORF type:complete len:192 (+),score=75.42 GHRR01009420.1:701-1276(+)
MPSAMSTVLCRPPSQLGPGTGVVYLFGDPLACVASHFRRHHAYHQALKTSGNPQLDEATFAKDFQEYVTRGEDLFGLQQHLHNWLQVPTAYDVLFVRYSNMFDQDVALAMFQYLCGSSASNNGTQQALKSNQEIQDMAVAFAAQKKQRASQVTAEQRQAMYIELAAEMEALPAVFIRQKDCSIVPLALTVQ